MLQYGIFGYIYEFDPKNDDMYIQIKRQDKSRIYKSVIII